MPYNASHQRLRQAQLAEVRLHAFVMREVSNNEFKSVTWRNLSLSQQFQAIG
jgi:hypothetical protein